MTKIAMAAAAVAIALALIVLSVRQRARENEVRRARTKTEPASAPMLTTAQTHPAAENPQGFIYGRIVATDGTTYEGRMRFGGTEEAFWGDYFNGAKRENPWAAKVPAEQRPKKRGAIEIFGLEIASQERPADLNRPFRVPFGDVARVESRGRDVLVTLKSGALFDIDRFGASDFDDGVRVWDAKRGVVDLDSLQIRTIDFLPTPSLGDIPYRLYGTVRTSQVDFTGFIQWNREACVGTDELVGVSDNSEVRLRFDALRSIARRADYGAQATLLDGREIELAELGDRGIYVDDARYGHVLVSWDAFDRVEFSAGGSGPAYADYPAGRPLTGAVTTRAGARLAGRIVFDLDETETTETLDAPSHGVDYTIPFGLVASIVPRRLEPPRGGQARVTLVNGEELQLDEEGDLGEQNAGILVFPQGRDRPEYVPWPDVAQVEFDRPGR